MANTSDKLVIAGFRGGILTCFFEDGAACELNFEGASDSLVGNIYSGRVKNIVKNINAAFVDIGAPLPAFLDAADAGAFRFSDGAAHDRLREGDALIVKVKKDAQKTKGPSVTGRFREAGDPEILRKAQFAAAPALLKAAEPEWLFLARRYRNRDAEIVTDLPAVYEALTGSAPEEEAAYRQKLPERFRTEQALKKASGTGVPVRFYSDRVLPLSSVYSLETVVGSALAKNVWLKSGGYLVIEPTEAMTVIDVNTGKTDRKGTKEETVRRTDEEAADEIMRQLRLRNLSGIIVADFIDLHSKELREALMERLRALAASDPVKTEIVDLTGLHLVEITRKKAGKPLKDRLAGHQNSG